MATNQEIELDVSEEPGAHGLAELFKIAVEVDRNRFSEAGPFGESLHVQLCAVSLYELRIEQVKRARWYPWAVAAARVAILEMEARLAIARANVSRLQDGTPCG